MQIDVHIRFTLATPQRKWPTLLQQSQKCASLAAVFFFTPYKTRWQQYFFSVFTSYVSFHTVTTISSGYLPALPATDVCVQQSHAAKRLLRAVSAALHTPQLGGARCHRGPKVQSRHHLAPQRNLRSPKLKYEALEISEFRGPFEIKVHYSFFGPLWQQGIYTLQLLLG